MSEPVIITLAGEPKGKGRPRFVRKTGRAFTPEKTRTYEAALRYTAQETMAGRELLEGALIVNVDARFAIPQSWSKKRKAEAYWHTGRPDADNLLKTLDSLNGVVWLDDAQIAHVVIRKQYASAPMLVITVETAE